MVFICEINREVLSARSYLFCEIDHGAIHGKFKILQGQSLISAIVRVDDVPKTSDE